MSLSQRSIVDLDHAVHRLMHLGSILGHFFSPRPGVPEEHLGENVEIGGIGTSVVSGDSNRDSIDVLFVLGVLKRTTTITVRQLSAAKADLCGQPSTLTARPSTHLDKDIPISILLKRIGIQNLVLADIPTSMSRFLLQLLVREFALGVLVKELHVRVGRGGIEVVVELLDIFSVVTWWTRIRVSAG